MRERAERTRALLERAARERISELATGGSDGKRAS
jgi:hypothetical protein